jgi:hypothetical protein
MVTATVVVTVEPTVAVDVVRDVVDVEGAIKTCSIYMLVFYFLKPSTINMRSWTKKIL